MAIEKHQGDVKEMALALRRSHAAYDIASALRGPDAAATAPMDLRELVNSVKYLVTGRIRWILGLSGITVCNPSLFPYPCYTIQQLSECVAQELLEGDARWAGLKTVDILSREIIGTLGTHYLGHAVSAMVVLHDAGYKVFRDAEGGTQGGNEDDSSA